jgi:hypothetical protein
MKAGTAMAGPPTRRLRSALLLALSLLAASGAALARADERPVVKAYYFFSPDCGVCEEIRTGVFPGAEKALGIRLDVEYFNIDEITNVPRLVYLEKRIGRKSSKFPVIFLGDTFIAGEDEIKSDFLRVARDAVGPGRERQVARILSHYTQGAVGEKELLKELSLPAVIGSGLLDGINPCAFSTLIFLISFLFFVGADRRQIVVVGAFYTLGVFLTYLATGIGFFNVLKAFAGYKFFAYAIKYSALGLLGVFIALSVYDIVKYMITKKADFTLSLPRPLQKRIHEAVRRLVQRRTFFLSAFLLGVVLSLFELACTGQIYVPIILSILQSPHLRVHGVLYLLLYNLFFILPLLVVFAAAYFGVTSKALEGFFRKNLLLIKLLTAGLFVFLFIYLVGFRISL